MHPFVSVIIPCRNEAVSIGRCLESILASDYPPDRMEVIVADGCSDDETRAVLGRVAAEDARVRLIENSARITPVALNRAIEVAHGDLILRIDAHSTVAPEYIPALVRFLEACPNAWGAGGHMTTEPETHGPFSQAISIVLSHRFGVGNSSFRTGRAATEPYRVDTVFNCCWRRDLFRRIGVFNEHLVRSQDIEFSRRIAAAGGSLWLVPAARTTYFARTEFWRFVRHNWTNGIWSIMPAIHVGYLPVRLRHLIPLAFVSSILLSAIGAGMSPLLRWLPLAPALPYICLSGAASVHSAVRHRAPKLALLLPLSFAALHLGYGAGSLVGAFHLVRHWAKRPATSPQHHPSTSL
jgi:succinoglycan biosynthesis protein ExoA